MTGGSVDGARLFLVLGFLVLVVVINRAVQPVEAYWQGKAGIEISRVINVEIMSKATQVPFQNYDIPSYYDKLDRAKREASSNPVDMLLYTMWVVQAMISFIGMFAVVISFRWWAAGVILLTSFPGIVFQYSVSRRSWKVMNEASPQVRKLNYVRDILTTRQPAKEVRLLGLGAWLRNRYDQLYSDYARDFMRSLRLNTGTNLLLSPLSGAGLAAIQVTIVSAAARKSITIGDLTFYIQAVTGTHGSLQALTSYVGGVLQRSMFASNLVEFLGEESDSSGEDQTVRLEGDEGLESHDVGQRPLIQFKDVEFSYPGGEEIVLKKTSFAIHRGERVAIVGRNGAGKTTIVNSI